MKSFYDRYPDQADELRQLETSVESLASEDRLIVMDVLARYTMEADRGSYQTEPDELVKFIVDNRLIDNSEGAVDLGAGPGQLLSQLAVAYPGLQMRGVDLSPGFVESFSQRNRQANAKMRVGLIDAPMQNADILKGGSVVSVLTLDRLVNPRGLIENMGRFERARILATLLPVVPEDDNPSRQGEGKIIYTRQANRITLGVNAAEDRVMFQALLSQVWKRPVEFAEVPYVVESSGDRQPYDLGVFYARG